MIFTSTILVLSLYEILFINFFLSLSNQIVNNNFPFLAALFKIERYRKN
jgi:hypothetical protein